MIDVALDFLKEEVENHLELVNNKIVDDDGFIVLSNVASQNGDWAIPSGKIGMSLINVEEERVIKDQVFEHRNSNGTYERYNPALKLNLYVLFCANYVNSAENNNTSTYREGLKQLSNVISFFQSKYVFSPESSPNMPVELEKLIVDIYSYSFEQQYNFWSILGAKYLPSVLYKVRLVSYQNRAAENQSLPITDMTIITSENN
ncbi:hypothetical protein GCM10009118_21200 [Wandonia haliotis]|uniref:Pvc16 N-terminal domain-containing protein n=1 Tax=Wandonia haliotis TaxID=574963 RepID=A0ABN1MQU2_9FLAO